MNIMNVKTFRGFEVVGGTVQVQEEEYAGYIDQIYEVYDPIVVAGITFSASRVLKECDPVAFRCGLGDYESEIQAELENAIENEDDSEIEWLEEEEE